MAFIGIIHTLAEINQSLDWEIPSEIDQRMKIADIIDKLEALCGVPSVHTAAAAAAAKKAYLSLCPSSVPLPIVQPVRKKHLTLVWSKKQ